MHREIPPDRRKKPASLQGKVTISGVDLNEVTIWDQCAELEGRSRSNWIRQAAREKMERQLRRAPGTIPADGAGAPVGT